MRVIFMTTVKKKRGHFTFFFLVDPRDCVVKPRGITPTVANYIVHDKHLSWFSSEHTSPSVGWMTTTCLGSIMQLALLLIHIVS